MVIAQFEFGLIYWYLYKKNLKKKPSFTHRSMGTRIPKNVHKAVGKSCFWARKSSVLCRLPDVIWPSKHDIKVGIGTSMIFVWFRFCFRGEKKNNFDQNLISVHFGSSTRAIRVPIPVVTVVYFFDNTINIDTIFFPRRRVIDGRSLIFGFLLFKKNINSGKRHDMFVKNNVTRNIRVG